MSNKNKLDQYYTNPLVAKTLWRIVDEVVGEDCSYVEPSAGCGAFLREGKDIIGYDLDPKHPHVIERDFFSLGDELKGKVIIGNPPYGFASSLAVKFINHCVDNGATHICFVLPNTFNKELFRHDNLHPTLNLIYSEKLPKNSFILDGEPYDVPSSFHIYKVGSTVRDEIVIHQYLTIGSEEDHNFILRRVGGRAGQVLDSKDFNKNTCYYVKGDSKLIDIVSDEIKTLRDYTAGVRSITIREINWLLTNKLGGSSID